MFNKLNFSYLHHFLVKGKMTPWGFFPTCRLHHKNTSLIHMLLNHSENHPVPSLVLLFRLKTNSWMSKSSWMSCPVWFVCWKLKIESLDRNIVVRHEIRSWWSLQLEKSTPPWVPVFSCHLSLCSVTGHKDPVICILAPYKHLFSRELRHITLGKAGTDLWRHTAHRCQ